MFTLEELQWAVHQGRVRITSHAKEEMWNDRVNPQEVFFTVLQGNPEVVESYPKPQGRPFPMMLVLGWLPDGTPLHSLWAYDGEKKIAILVTVYRPDPSRWDESFRKRKQGGVS